MASTRPSPRALPVAILGLLFVWATLPRADERPQDSAQAPAFEVWLAALKSEALERGISAGTVEAALGSLEAPEPVVVERDRAQPEQVQTLDDYLRQRLSTRTQTTARTMFRTHRRVLQQVDATYGITAPMLVAVWGLESNFGRFTGTRPTIAALATLAFDPRRSALFRRELFDALTILDRGHIALADLKGSWAGAMGQPQFMPSSYLKHAVDFDKDGRADIWHSEADVFASIANYLHNAGWVDGERWGREVRISRTAMERVNDAVPMRQSGCLAVKEMTESRPLAEWSALGVLQADGKPLPRADMDASLIRGAGVRGSGRTFLVYRNYHALIDYNCSNSYALSAGLLADRIW